MILEGLVTTLNEDGSVNIAPMGPIVDESMRDLVLRPFPTSRTYANLKRLKCGVFHVTDDVLLLARAALDQIREIPDLESANVVDGLVLRDCCRWYEFDVESIDESGMRPVFKAVVVHCERRRDFIGFNRAKHAVIEAAILASRLHLIGATGVLEQLERLKVSVDKTGGDQEREAFALVEDFVNDWAKMAVTSAEAT